VTTKIVIGVSGRASSGKDTFADILVRDYGFTKLSFADPMKLICQEIFDFTHDQLWGDSKHRDIPDTRYRILGTCPHCRQEMVPTPYALGTTPVAWTCTVCSESLSAFLTPRLALQTLGTEWGRTLYPAVWTDKLQRDIERNSHKRWVITDIRFRNELVVANALGPTVRLLRGKTTTNHVSENELTDEDDYTIKVPNQTDPTLGEIERGVIRAVMAVGIEP